MKMENRDIMEKYIDSYMSHLDEMLKHHEGKFTIFAEEEPLGFWDTKIKALEEGIKKYGIVSMLVREVSKEYIECERYGKPIVISSRVR